MRLPGVGLRTVRALSQASTLRPQAPTFVPAGSHRNASVLNYTPNTFAFPPLLAANMPPPPPQHTLMDMSTRFQTQQDAQNAVDAEPELALYSYKDTVPTPALYYVVHTDAAETLLSLSSIHGPLGFDLEWRPTFAKGAPENPVALLQLADASSGAVYLFHLSRMKAFPEQLRVLLNDATIVKAGVGIQNDCKKLWKDWKVSVQGVVDLSMLARSVDSQWKGAYHNSIGLARLVEVYKHRRMAKSKKLQLSNWEIRLSTAAQEYAANDAHAGLILYQHLHSLAQRKIPVPLPIYYSFDCVRGVLYEQLTAVPLPAVSTNSVSAVSSDGGELEEDFSSTWDDAEPLRSLWLAQNPEYDPGPPPPPRPPRPAPEAIEMQDQPDTSPTRKKRNANKHVFSNALPIVRAPRHTPNSPPRMGSWNDHSRPSTPRDFMKPQPRSASPVHAHHNRPMPQALISGSRPRETTRYVR